ncbi:MAG: CRTAC1 family protein [Caldilinea sp.]|nr:CRTAC1 family protein [Caldilineaceae bacterium]MCO5210993.1 CRTAC1 family protein [Caldilinea sp.]MCW5841285.1 CRTAC1 family protein [Caldilinea sp.]
MHAQRIGGSCRPARRWPVHRLASVAILGALLWMAATPTHPAIAMPPAQDDRDSPPITVQRAPLAEDAACEDRFVTHTLDHVTTIEGNVVQMFEANGAGLAAGDLDGDGDLDLLLGNHDGPDSLFWNEGDLAFRKENFSTGKTRDVKIVDVNADGLPDVVLTRNTGTLNYFENGGDGTFQRRVLPGVAAPAYVTNWADLDGDGDLDLVTGSYDAGLLTDRGNEYIVGNARRGVYYYTNDNGRFRMAPLATEAQALAILFPDLNGDGKPDILVGNDFNTPDMAWVRAGDGWADAGDLLVAMTHSTMSYDQADVDNSGDFEIFAADMKPYPGETMGGWEPMMDAMMVGMVQEQMAADPQIMENVLLVPGEDGRLWNMAPDWGVDGTGWTWSSKFGDLNLDGYVDLYTVNGMIEERLFAHLPDHELVEENQAFRNEEGLRFERMPGWDLDSPNSGRGMVMADLDGDGDLDIVVNNLRGPARLFENRLCRGGEPLLVNLRWPDSANPFAIGAHLRLVTDAGTQLRDIRVGSGYLSGDAPVAHFAMPAGATIEALEITWPDGTRSRVEDVAGGTSLTIERGG